MCRLASLSSCMCWAGETCTSCCHYLRLLSNVLPKCALRLYKKTKKPPNAWGIYRAKPNPSAHVAAIAQHLDEHVCERAYNPQRDKTPPNSLVHFPSAHGHRD
jgi:hypothetical protein